MGYSILYRMSPRDVIGIAIDDLELLANIVQLHHEGKVG